MEIYSNTIIVVMNENVLAFNKQSGILTTFEIGRVNCGLVLNVTDLDIFSSRF